jgi:hypothetical protein
MGMWSALCISTRPNARGRAKESSDPATMRRLLTNFRDSTLRMLGRRQQFQTLIVTYAELMIEPQPWLERIATFLGGPVDPREWLLSYVWTCCGRRLGARWRPGDEVR